MTVPMAASGAMTSLHENVLAPKPWRRRNTGSPHPELV